MASEGADNKLEAAGTKFRLQIERYIELFKAAFDELHEAVLKHIKVPGKYIGPHYDYPVMSFLDSGFPTFHDAGFYRNSSPRKYVETVRPRGLAAMFSGQKFPEVDLPKSRDLATFLRENEIGKRLDLSSFTLEGKQFDGPVESLVEDAVERYLHIYGLDDTIDSRRRNKIIRPLIAGSVLRSLDLTLVVPIAMAHFDVDHFRLTETTYIARLPRKVQLARMRISTRGTGAVQNVVGAATHAFVSNGWQLEVEDVNEVRKSLGELSENVVDAIDSFFGAMRIATGINTGYAQVVWMPRKWALDYFCDLTPLFGVTTRQYPSRFDSYGWVGAAATVTVEQLDEVRRIYRALLADGGEAVRLALRRLNSCLTRTDAADAILDGTIGLELLLGDDQNQSLAYKLRLRAAALTFLRKDAAISSTEIASKVKRLYEARSAIVHGRRKKRSKKASEPADTKHLEERIIASEVLRFVLDIVLTNPEYQQPSKIDEGILLRGDHTTLVDYRAAGSKRGRSPTHKRAPKKD